MLKFIVLNNPGEEWDSFASRYSDIFFHTSSWGKVVAEGYGAELRYYCLYDNDEMVIGMPGFIYDLRFFRMLYSNVPYGGLIGKREYMRPFLDMLKADLKKENIHRVRMVNFPGASLDLAENELSADLHPSSESFHHLLEIRGKIPDEIQKGYSDSLRWSLNKATREGVSVRRIDSRDAITEAYNCYLVTMRRNNAPASLPISVLYAIYDNLIPDHADIFVAVFQDKCIAFMCIVYSKDYAHSFATGSLTEYLQYRPNDLLNHTTIMEAKRKGKGYFDFIGTTSREDINLALYKEKWGAKRGELPIFIWEVSRVRCGLWNAASRCAKTRAGSRFAGWIRGRDAGKA